MGHLNSKRTATSVLFRAGQSIALSMLGHARGPGAFASRGDGNVAIIFALSLVPAIGLTGLAIDYASANMNKRKLDAAADAVVLNAVSNSSNSGLTQPTQTWAQANFTASAGRIPNLTISSVAISSSYVGGNLQVSVSYQASMPTYFGSMFSVRKINISGTARSVAPLPTFSDFYFLLDNSPSMGFAASLADIAKMQSVTPDHCAFACHQHTATGAGIVGDNPSDYYHIAKANGVTTRMDMLRTSTQQILDLAVNMQGSTPRYRSAVYTFSDVFQTIAPLSSDLQSVKSQAEGVDLAYSYRNFRNSQTDYETALKYLTPLVGASGDGKTSSSPSKYVLLITDGVQDQPVGSASGTGDGRDGYAPPNQTTTSPPAAAQQNIANTHAGNVPAGNYVRSIGTIDPAQCLALKSNGVKIAVLYTKYMPQTSDSTYNTFIAPISNDIPNKLSQCASDNLFFTVDPSGDISMAMSSMFNAIANGRPRLIN